MLLAPLVPTPLHCGNINIGGASVEPMRPIMPGLSIFWLAITYGLGSNQACSRNQLFSFLLSRILFPIRSVNLVVNFVRGWLLVKLGAFAFHQIYAHVPEHKLRVYIVYLFFYYRIEESFQRRQRYHFCLLVGKVAAVIMNPENKTDKTVKIS